MRTVWIAALAFALTMSAQARDEWLAGFANRVLREGHQASLPPHLSLVMGLSSGEEAVPVMQFGTKSGSVIRQPQAMSGDAARPALAAERIYWSRAAQETARVGDSAH